MASTNLLRNVAPLRLNRCAPTPFTSTTVHTKIGRRHIGLKYLAKVKDAENAWQEKAKEHHANGTHFLDMMEERGFVHQLAG